MKTKHGIYYQFKAPSPLLMIWREFHANPISVAAYYLLAVIVLAMLLAPILAPYSPEWQFTDVIYLPPAWHPEGEMRFVFGTDDLGRDILSRVLYGAWYSLGYPLIATFIAAFIGTTIGAWAGMSRGVQSSTLTHFLDVVLTIPSLLLALVIVAIFGPSLHTVMIAITLVLIPQFIHSVQNAVYTERAKEYVIAARLNGCSRSYILKRVIFPNITSVIVVQLTFALSTAILDIAALGFLGLGVQSPAPEWGTMLARSLDHMYLNPWSMLLPGLMLFVTVLSINILGDNLHRAIQQQERLS